MKKVFVISIVAVILYSCNGSQEKLELQAQVDSLTAVNASQTQQLKEITDFMSIVSEGLDSIAEQEGGGRKKNWQKRKRGVEESIGIICCSSYKAKGSYRTT